MGLIINVLVVVVVTIIYFLFTQIMSRLTIIHKIIFAMKQVPGLTEISIAVPTFQRPVLVCCIRHHISDPLPKANLSRTWLWLFSKIYVKLYYLKEWY